MRVVQETMSHVSLTRLGRWAFLVLALAGVILAVVISSSIAFKSNSAAESSRVLPGRVEHVEGTNVNRVVLTTAAIGRLGITTQVIRDEPAPAGAHRVMPYAAVLYDASGETWVYTNTEPGVYVRERVTVDSIQGDRAVLSGGPAAGTQVVTVGATELYGTEFGVSGDE
jgi:hypothetical protein